MKRYIEIIRTERSRNMAYICYRQDEPYWATNLEVRLDWVENVLNAVLNDGEHPFITIPMHELNVGIENLDVINKEL